MRVTLINISLGSGGAERVIAMMATYWARQGWEVSLITLTGADVPDFYEIHPAVRRRRLGVAGPSSSPFQALLNNANRLWSLGRAIKENNPDAVISFQSRTNVLVILSCRALGQRVLVSERVDPTREPIGWAWSVLRRLLYPLASCVVVQTGSVRDYFRRGPRPWVRVIPNPVGCPARDNLGVDIEARPEGRILVAAGRLVPQKGFDLLIRAFAAIAREQSDWTLVIWGEGPMRGDLEALRDQFGLIGRVRLPGITRSLASEFSAADLFVLSSRYEGFPNVLCEAMALGLPTVSFDCPSGPSDILRDGVDGVLVPPEDVSALAKTLGSLMGDVTERRRLGSRASEIAERFSLEKVMRLWEEAIHDASGRRGMS